MGGRCNSIGVSAVYTSENVALAVLEVLLHLDRVEIPRDYVLLGVLFEGGQAHDATPEAARGLSKAGRYPILRVTSVVIPREKNFVLYPDSLGFEAQVAFVEPFGFDVRLFVPTRSI